MITFSYDGNCYSNCSFFLACCSGHVCESTGHRYCCSLRSHQRRGHTQHATASENLTPQSAAFFVSSFRFSFWTFCHEALLSQLLTTTPMVFSSRHYFYTPTSITWAHGVVVSHPLSMREALGSIPSVSNVFYGLSHDAAEVNHNKMQFSAKTQCKSGHCYHHRKKSIDMVYCSSFCTLYKHLWSSGYDVSLTR